MKIHIATYQDRAKKLSEDLSKDKSIQKLRGNVVIRLGGSKEYNEYPYEINSAAAVRNCINKKAMKRQFIANGIKTLPFYEDAIRYPFMIKHTVGSGGEGVNVVEDEAEFRVFKKIMSNQYYIEPIFRATSEYRVFATQSEVFFFFKKIKRDENANEVVLTTKNHYGVRDFPRPRLWNQIHAECIRAMRILNLDIGAFDVGYSSAGNHDFVLYEVNTNPELLANAYNKYLEIIPKILTTKYKK